MGNARERLIQWAQTIRPAFVSRNPHFNFITLHCKIPPTLYIYELDSC